MNGLRVLLADVDPTGLPAPLWLLQFLLVFTFVLHLFFLNVVLGGGLVWLWASWRGRRRAAPRRGAPDYAALAHSLGRVLPVTTAFAITTGVAPLLFTQLLYGQLFYTSSVLMAWPWLAVVALLLVGYYVNYFIFYSRAGSARAVALGLASAVLFAGIGFLFTTNMTLMLRPEQHLPMYLASDAGLHGNVADGWVWPRFAHMLVGSLAITGLAVAWIARLRRRLDRTVAAGIERYGTRLFAAATLVEFVVGVGLFLSLPRPVRDIFVAGRTPDVILLVAGIAFALAAVAIVRRSLLVGSCAAIVALADMAIVRHRVRDLLLEPYFRTGSLVIAPQTGMFLLFAAMLVAGLAVVAWMVWRFASATPRPSTKPLAQV